MANYADSATDLKLAQMEKRIARIYKDASDDLQKRANDYFSSFAARYEKEYDAYLEGKYTDAQFKAWYYAQVGRGERWQTLKTDMAKRMTKANQIAAAYVNDNTPGIYALNANFAAYEIEAGTGIAFNLVNEQTVKNLMEGKNFTEFRTLSVNPVRDYNWNTQKIQDALLSGILQGDSIKTLTGRYLDVMGMNLNAAIRNARTAVTSAQNGGRQSTFNKAKAMGIDMQKEWIATNDSRTRDSHRELDGVRVENEDPFPNGCMFPGDPGGEPAEVYNCRCTMRAILPKYNGARRTNNTKASYSKWVIEKQRRAFTTTGEDDKIYLRNGEGYYGDVIHNAVGSAARGVPDVINPFTGDKIQFVPGTRPYFPPDSVMAGKGCKTGRQIDDIERLVTEYPGTDAKKWQKRKAQYNAYDENGEIRVVEIHYYQNEAIGRVEDKPKIKNGSIYVDEW